MFKHFLKPAAIAIIAVAAISVSCQEKDPDGPQGKKVTVQGTVTDQDTEEAIAGATVSVAGVSATTGADGKYELQIAEVTAATKITAAADKYADRSANLTPAEFEEGVATKDFALQFKGGEITGRVLNSAGVGVENAEVSLGTIASTKSDAQGNYKFQDLVRDDYTVTIKYDGQTIERSVSKADFASGSVEIAPVFVGSDAVLPYGVTRNDLCEAPELLYNIYTAGTGHWGNGSDYTYELVNHHAHPAQRWLTAVWALKTMIGPSVAESDFYAAQDKLDTYEESALRSDIINSAEGLALRTRFLKKDADNYASYIYGRKTITNDNFMLGIRTQCYVYGSCTEANLYLGIVDLSKAEFKVDEMSLNLGNYDGDIVNASLAAYVGKEVVIILGVKQVCESTNHKSDWFGVHISTITFGKSNLTEEYILPGTEAKSGYGVTKESAASIGVLAPGTYVGTYNSAFRKTYVTELVYPMDFRCYAGSNHIVANFAYQYMNATPDVTTDFTMHVNTAEGVSTAIPSAVLYAKVAAGGSVTVNGSVSNGTLGYGFLVVKEDGSAEALEVKDANSAVAAVCDLSAYTGNVLVGFCVYPRKDADAALKIENIQIR